MRVLCCYVQAVNAFTAVSLAAHAPGTEYVCVAGDDRAYGREIASRWDGTGDLVVIEQDNEITADVLPSFAACPAPWCVYEYECFAPPWTAIFSTCLGCTRFSAALQQAIDLPRLLGEPCECGAVHNAWGDLDHRIATLAGKAGFSPHVHGKVRHLHPYQPYDPEDPELFAMRQGPLYFKGGFKNITTPRG